MKEQMDTTLRDRLMDGSLPLSPALVRALGDTCAVFLSALLWETSWFLDAPSDTRDSEDGWIQITVADITAEIGLTADQQKGARRKLRTLHLLEETYRRKQADGTIGCWLCFRINRQTFEEFCRIFVA